MTNWKTKTVSIDSVKVGEKTEIAFELVAKDKVIASVRQACNCTVSKFDKKTKKLKVTFTPNPFPAHLRDKSTYKALKMITVYFEDGTHDVLTILANVYKK